MTEAVETYGGVVRSFMGDGIAAFFGIDGAREDDPVRAALAGLKIVEVVQRYAAEIEVAWGLRSLAVRVGINAGRVATCLVGGAEPQHVALGDPVNVGARLQSCADAGTVLIGASVAARIADRFELQSLGALKVKGRAGQVEAWCLGLYKGPSEPDAQGHFVGRTHELGTLARVARELSLGRGQVVLVVGEPGIGKSRLAVEFRERLDGAAWFYAICGNEHVLRPYGPFVDILRSWLDTDRGTPAVLTKVRLLARAREMSLSEVSVVPSLARLLGIELDTSAAERPGRQSDEVRASSIRQAFATWLLAAAGDRPVVLALDDFDRCDESTASLAGDLCLLTESMPVLVLLIMRPEPETVGWRVRAAALTNQAHRTKELQLLALTVEESDELAAVVDEEHRLTQAARRDLTVRAEGNPFHLVELVRAATESVRESGSAAGRHVNLALPPRLEGILLARVDRLPDPSRRVLQMAAVCGRRFSRDVLRDAAGQASVDAELQALVRAGILQEDGRTPEQHYAFRHVLHQEVVASTLPPSRLAELHERAAEALERSREAEAMLEQIAGHYLASGNTAKAQQYLARAGERAASLSSLAEAARLYDRAASLGAVGEVDGSDAMCARRGAELTTQMGRYEEAMSRWTSLLESAHDDDYRAEVLLEVARTKHELRQDRDVEEICSQCLSLAPPLTTRLKLWLLLARIALRRDDLETAAKYLDLVESMGPEAESTVELECAALRAAYRAQNGELAEASVWAGRAMTLAGAGGQFDDLLRTKRDLGIIHLLLGRLRSARELLTEVLSDAMESSRGIRAQEAVSNLVAVHLQLGELEQGALLAKEALDWLHVPAWRAALLFNLGSIETERGHAGEARERLLACVALAHEGEESRLLGVLAEIGLAGVDLRQGDTATALTRATEASRWIEGLTGRLDVALRVKARLAEVRLRQSELSDALNCARAAVDLAAHCDRTESPLAWRVLGSVEMAAGEAGSRASLERSLELAAEMGMRLDEARAHVALGSLDGQPQGQHFREARRIFADCGCQLGLRELRDAVACYV